MAKFRKLFENLIFDLITIHVVVVKQMSAIILRALSSLRF